MSFSARMAWVAHRLALGLRMARPGFLAITAVGCLVGMASAQAAGGVDGARALFTLLLALMLHAAANMLNDHVPSPAVRVWCRAAWCRPATCAMWHWHCWHWPCRAACG